MKNQHIQTVLFGAILITSGCVSPDARSNSQQAVEQIEVVTLEVSGMT